MEHQVYRVKVVEYFLRTAVPFSKLQHFIKLLEETGYRLTDRHCTGDLIPVVLKQEKSRIQSEVSEQNVSLIFDGTS